MFSAKELLSVAIRVEKEGEEFYRKLSDRFKDKPDIKEFFSYMSRQESEHARTFEKIGEELKVSEETYLDLSDAEEYLKSFVEGRFFPDTETMEKYLKEKSVEEAIDFSISVEKETIIFYYEILELLKNEKAKSLVKGIIEQEKQHVVKLLRVKGMIA
ncbi:ferritin family protein [Thermotoga sp. KOL6]|uniref:ferritin-like domain-containing protein n=1 Tax=Thermotoga sp. KOL6 TaxID=126741 RepID=UPI000CB9D4EC|nr:ferritin family protein [Thermotoga sp. KOL6]PLV58693.1 ferritin [Thermotoga sp. KOL6]